MPTTWTWLGMGLLIASCLDDGSTEVGHWSEGAPPPDGETEEPPILYDEEEADLEDDWDEHCSWASSVEECDECGGGGCVASCELGESGSGSDAGTGDSGAYDEWDDWGRDAGSGDASAGDEWDDYGDGDADSDADDWGDGGDDGSDESDWTDDDCDAWYGGGGHCPECSSCCWADGCVASDETGEFGEPADESDWTDEDCDLEYGGGGHCFDCAACCWSESCW